MHTKFLTGKEIASILKISKALAYQLMASGQIQSVRFNHTVRVQEADLEAFIARNSVGQSHSTGEADNKITQAMKLKV